MLEGIDREYEMYVPDMPVAGEEYFDREFYNSHYSEIVSAYSLFEDDYSKFAYANIINYKLTGKMKYLMDAFSNKDELYGELPVRDVRTYIDAGAYNGDTAREAIAYFPNLDEKPEWKITADSEEQTYFDLEYFFYKYERVGKKSAKMSADVE